MSNSPKFSQALLQAAAQLELKAKRNVSALLAGNYRSAFRGSGMQFKEFRHYEPGDDIRHMSWSVTARTRRATVKTFEEEREFDVILAVDVSGSSQFGMGAKRKIDMYGELVALLSLAAVHSGDNVGLLLFDEAPRLFLPPKRSRNQVMLSVSAVISQELNLKRSNLVPVFPYLQSVLKNRSLIIVMSDFLMPNFDAGAMTVGRKHELVMLHCYDDAERGNGVRGVYEVWDPESGEFLILDANSKRTRQVLAEFHTQHSANLETIAKNCRADYLCLCVEDDYLQRLVHFFRQRGPSRL